MLILKNYAVNHYTYPKGPTYMEKIACVKRHFVRVNAQVFLTKDRITNLYNPSAGAEIPTLPSAPLYIIRGSPDRLKQPAVSYSNGEGPKVNLRRKMLEFGISRSTKVPGRRKIHSTFNFKRKGSILTDSLKHKLSGFYHSDQLQILQSNITNGSISNNLSQIMSDPNFLIACWVRIKSKNNKRYTSLTRTTLHEIPLIWFQQVANTIINGKFHFQLTSTINIPTHHNKHTYTYNYLFQPHNIIILEAMRFLLEMIFEPKFRQSSHGFTTNTNYRTALQQVKMNFGFTNWFLQTTIESLFDNIDHYILIQLIQTQIQDQPFIDLIYKYLRLSIINKSPNNKGIPQHDLLSPLLANIYMHFFDQWIHDILIYEFKQIKPLNDIENSNKMPANGSISKNTRHNDSCFKQLRYIRYAHDFLIGISGSKYDCIRIREKINQFLQQKLKLNLHPQQTQIIHATNSYAHFLGYKIYQNKISKHTFTPCKKLTRSLQPILDAPINNIVHTLEQQKYAKNGQPTRNGRLIHLSLTHIITHYRNIERRILHYYAFANNYGRLAARIHYILKYSCALTITSKMRLKTLHKTFKKYGSDLLIKNQNHQIINSYPTINYKRNHNSNFYSK